MSKLAHINRVLLGAGAVSAGLALAFGLIALAGLAAHTGCTLLGLNPEKLHLLPLAWVAADEAAYPFVYFLNIGAGALSVFVVCALLLALGCFLCYWVGSSILDRKPAAGPVNSTAEEVMENPERIGTSGHIPSANA